MWYSLFLALEIRIQDIQDEAQATAFYQVLAGDSDGQPGLGIADDFPD